MPEEYTDKNIRANNGFGVIPKRRNVSRIQKDGYTLLFLSFLVMLFYSGLIEPQNFYVVTYSLSISVLAMIASELLRRSCLLAEEYRHKNSRYQGSIKKLLSRVYLFADTGRVVGITLAATLLALFSRYKASTEIKKSDFTTTVFLYIHFSMVMMLSYVAGFQEPSEVETSEMMESSNDATDGLVWSFYFGYLKIILPNLREQIIQSKEFGQKLRETGAKLYILLPRNCYCSSVIGKQEFINAVGVIRSQFNRAGIKSRHYSNTVYEVKCPPSLKGAMSESYHCLIEFATPLLTLYEMSHDSKADLAEEERSSQVQLFYRKLKDLLDNDPACRGRYELVPLEDACDDHLAEVMVQCIRKGNEEGRKSKIFENRS